MKRKTCERKDFVGKGPDSKPWFLDKMVVHFTMRTYGVNQVFRIVEGIWINRNSHQIRNFYSVETYSISYVRNSFCATILFNYHESNSLYI